jgi:hypothetical protein
MVDGMLTLEQLKDRQKKYKKFVDDYENHLLPPSYDWKDYSTAKKVLGELNDAIKGIELMSICD